MSDTFLPILSVLLASLMRHQEKSYKISEVAKPIATNIS